GIGIMMAPQRQPIGRLQGQMRLLDAICEDLGGARPPVRVTREIWVTTSPAETRRAAELLQEYHTVQWNLHQNAAPTVDGFTEPDDPTGAGPHRRRGARRRLDVVGSRPMAPSIRACAGRRAPPKLHLRLRDRAQGAGTCRRCGRRAGTASPRLRRWLPRLRPTGYRPLPAVGRGGPGGDHAAPRRADARPSVARATHQPPGKGAVTIMPTLDEYRAIGQALRQKIFGAPTGAKSPTQELAPELGRISDE